MTMIGIPGPVKSIIAIIGIVGHVAIFVLSPLIQTPEPFYGRAFSSNYRKAYLISTDNLYNIPFVKTDSVVAASKENSVLICILIVRTPIKERSFLIVDPHSILTPRIFAYRDADYAETVSRVGIFAIY